MIEMILQELHSKSVFAHLEQDHYNLKFPNMRESGQGNSKRTMYYNNHQIYILLTFQ
jgi:hypothetical protein